MPAAGPFEALGDSNRRAILELLGDGGRSVQQLADDLPISRPAVSRHLRVLKDAGLVDQEVVGTRRIYRLQAEGVDAVQRYLEAVWGDVARRFALVAENTAPRRGEAMIEPLHLDLQLRCEPEHAFDVWTRRTSTWWPVSHSVSRAEGISVTIEPFEGGRIYERTPDGVEHDWGEVTVWEPPARLGYRWHLRRDRADATDVLVTFAAGDDGGCRVTIDHRGWERLGADGERWRDANRGGWAGLLPHFVAAAGPE